MTEPLDRDALLAAFDSLRGYVDTAYFRSEDLERAITAYQAAAPSPIQPGDLVEHIERPDLDYRRVIGVGEEWVFLDFQLGDLEAGELPTPLPKANYRKVQR